MNKKNESEIVRNNSSQENRQTSNEDAIRAQGEVDSLRGIISELSDEIRVLKSQISNNRD